MSKVLVDRDLLTEAVESLSDGLEDGPMESEASIADRTLVLRLKAAITQPAEAEGVSQKHEISCWKCHEMTSLETRNEMDGCCWACGEEIDLDDYLIKAMDKRDEHYAALSAVTAELENYKSWYDDAMDAGNIAGFSGMSAAQVIDYQDKEIMQLRAEVEGLRKDSKL